MDWTKLNSVKAFSVEDDASGIAERTFVFFDGEPREVIEIEKVEHGTLYYHLRPTEKCPDRSCIPEVDAHILSNDDKLLLCPERLFTDEELQEALRVATKTRVAESDTGAATSKRKKAAKTKSPELEMDAAMMELLGLDKLGQLLADNQAKDAK